MANDVKQLSEEISHIVADWMLLSFPKWDAKYEKKRPVKVFESLITEFIREKVGADDELLDRDVYPLGYEGAAARNHLRRQILKAVGIEEKTR